MNKCAKGGKKCHCAECKREHERLQALADSIDVAYMTDCGFTLEQQMVILHQWEADPFSVSFEQAVCCARIAEALMKKRMEQAIACGVPVERFLADIRSPENDKRVQRGIDQAIAAGVSRADALAYFNCDELLRKQYLELGAQNRH